MMEVENGTELRKSFMGEGEDKAILLLIAGVFPHDGAKGRNPVRQIPIDGVALFFKNTCCTFVLFLKSDAPVIVKPVKSSDNKEAAVLEEWIPIKVTMPGAHL